MPISYPVSKTVISTTQWGIPVTDAVNANTNGLAALQPTPWTTMTPLTNGWTVAGGAGQAQYRKIGDMVYLRGMISGGVGGAVPFTLPVGYRPPFGCDFLCYMWPGSPGLYLMTIASDGKLLPQIINGVALQYCSIGQVFFSTLTQPA